MKRLLMIVLSFALASVCASAQYRNDVAVDSLDGIMVKKGGALMLDGMKIAKEGAQLHIPEYYDRWRKANAGYKTGLGLTIAGCALGAIHVVSYWPLCEAVRQDPPGWLFPINKDFEDPFFVFSGYLMTATFWTAIPCILAGVPTLCVYNSRLKHIASDYNAGRNSNDAYLTFGGQANGIGLALNF
ncbi:MAG: hypothetical protein IJ271_06750 [Bacteroidales bacterium]|nr:hypothetical protein [Bacteroidales bacterium]MBQ8049337.1 hypothetical protein [Bacteroidales bacterium]